MMSLRRVLVWIGRHPFKSLSLGIGIALLVLILLIPRLRRPLIIVENISMPKTLSEAGYTSEAITNDIRSALMRIDAEAPDDNRGRRPTSIRSSDDKDSLNLEIAGTKIGYQQVLQLLQENFG